MRTLPLLAVAVFATLWATPTQAETPVVVTGTQEREFSMRVPFADLSLASEAGQNTLRSRVKSAANQVCGAYVDASNDAPYMTPYCSWTTYRAASPQIAAAIAQAQMGQRAFSAIRIDLASR